MSTEQADWPPGWEDALRGFSRAPSEAAWDALMLFMPLDDWYACLKSSLLYLESLGVDPDVLFLFGSKDGLLPVAIGWAQDGLVSPEVILGNLHRYASAEMHATMWGLAAAAYVHREDHFNTIRCLKRAVELDRSGRYAIDPVWRRADETLRSTLVKMGLTRGKDQRAASYPPFFICHLSFIWQSMRAGCGWRRRRRERAAAGREDSSVPSRRRRAARRRRGRPPPACRRP